jgi:hypothetical protein
VAQVFKSGVFSHKGQLNHANGSVPLFTDDYFGAPFMVGRAAPVFFSAMFAVHSFPVNEHDNVSILLNGA